MTTTLLGGNASTSESTSLSTVLRHFETGLGLQLGDDPQPGMRDIAMVGFHSWQGATRDSPASLQRRSPFLRKHVMKVLIINLDLLESFNFKPQMHAMEDLDFNLRISGKTRRSGGGSEYVSPNAAATTNIICKCSEFAYLRSFGGGGVPKPTAAPKSTEVNLVPWADLRDEQQTALFASLMQQTMRREMTADQMFQQQTDWRSSGVPASVLSALGLPALGLPEPAEDAGDAHAKQALAPAPQPTLQPPPQPPPQQPPNTGADVTAAASSLAPGLVPATPAAPSVSSREVHDGSSRSSSTPAAAYRIKRKPSDCAAAAPSAAASSSAFRKAQKSDASNPAASSAAATASSAAASFAASPTAASTAASMALSKASASPSRHRGGGDHVGSRSGSRHHGGGPSIRPPPPRGGERCDHGRHDSRSAPPPHRGDQAPHHGGRGGGFGAPREGVRYDDRERHGGGAGKGYAAEAVHLAVAEIATDMRRRARERATTSASPRNRATLLRRSNPRAIF